MDFGFSPRQQAWIDRVRAFIDGEIVPNIGHHDVELKGGETRWAIPPVLIELRSRARAEGLWNLFMPPHLGKDDGFAFEGGGLTNLEYAPLAEMMGRISWASRVFNCSPPDTGNMEILSLFGTPAQKEAWLRPLMTAEARSAFLMTEPDVASADATNIGTRIERDGDHYVVHGRKWWSTGVGDPECRFAIVMGRSADDDAPAHLQHSQIIVPLDAPGVKVERMLGVFGYDDAPYGHAEVTLTGVRVPLDHMLLGEGRGFEIAQGRLGPGRIHHCMRMIGAAEAALDAMIGRLGTRMVFGKQLIEQTVWHERIANARIHIDACRLLCLHAADLMDREGNKAARTAIALIKAAAPKMATAVIDDAIQAHGAAGLSADFALAKSFANIRALRIADGPDEVHHRTIARSEIRRVAAAAAPVGGERIDA
ncbi:acyl-CoA dehydrogenase [Sphingopyxis lindanitolerans]|uniref:Acyl-CoA dehydrogenase n=1 Tax=Sphingopyxis lindanitolerans TaxID=2054227 RepID=A0A2S8BAP8_9SPHN|nr:acyl-CoA dehydrogenase family protein [Sphingopyxis lindanitolerans]PQM29492.1 acyl-CoA dehydrogenase [Sphingopyxis lindanitolerans]